jgi:hypothetical protein
LSAGKWEEPARVAIKKKMGRVSVRLGDGWQIGSGREWSLFGSGAVHQQPPHTRDSLERD